MQIMLPMNATDPNWLSLRLSLWPHASELQHQAEMGDVLARGHHVRLAFTAEGSAVGFVEASKRVDYVNGATTSPVVFLEGLYVVPDARRQGIAQALLTDVEHWARAQGCRELASDCLLENVPAQAVHRALGFEETERVVYFRRPL